VATKTRALPTDEQIDVAYEKLGSARSDLDSFLTAVESHTNITEEGLALLLSGEPIPEGERPDMDTLARIVVFATDVLDGAAAFEKDARKLLAETRALYHDHNDGSLNPERRSRYQHAVKSWHEREAGRGEAVA